jgi:hypothetical protein
MVAAARDEPMAKKPIVVNGTEARQATKEGVVRYDWRHRWLWL